MSNCYCGIEKKFEECCAAILSGEQPASTAEQVMRARYSSFASGDVKYLETSQNPKTSDDLDMDSLKALGKNNFALDIFAMLAEILPRLDEGEELILQRDHLEQLFGVGSEDKKRFYNEKFLKALELVIEKAYPSANIRKEKAISILYVTRDKLRIRESLFVCF